MRAAVLSEIDKPLQIENVELAEPQAGEVLVRIAAVAVCHTDLSAQKGILPVPTPAVLGHEGAGIIEKVGAGVTSVQAGDKVVLTTGGSCGKCRYCWMGRPTLCEVFWQKRRLGTMMDGTRRLRRKDGSELNHFYFSSCFAEYSVVPERTAIKIPEESPLDKVCLFGCGATTGVGAVFNVAKVREGSSVAIFGCGGLGLSALLAAKLAGAGTIVCVDILDNKLAFAHQLGGSHRPCQDLC
jgi:Zn-dependent alcohol dehydrogenase